MGRLMMDLAQSIFVSADEINLRVVLYFCTKSNYFFDAFLMYHFVLL